MGSAAMIPILKSNSLNILYTDLNSNCSQTFFLCCFLKGLDHHASWSCCLVIGALSLNKDEVTLDPLTLQSTLTPALPLSGYELRLLLYGHFKGDGEPYPVNSSPSPGP